MEPSEWSIDPGERPPSREGSWSPTPHGSQGDELAPGDDGPPARGGLPAPGSEPTDPASGPYEASAPDPTAELPFGPPPFGPPPPGPPVVPPEQMPAAAPEPAPRSGGGSSRVRRGVAVAAVAAIVAAAAGFGVGRATTTTSPSGVVNQVSQPFIPSGTGAPATTLPAPLTGNEQEPAEAVARTVGPAVVQLQVQQGTSGDLGSGVIYDGGGLILTAAHVVGSSSTVRVQLADGTVADGKVLGADAGTDVAVVKIDVQGKVPVAALALGVRLQVGQTAIALGSPFGLDQTVTAGIVSALARPVPVGDQTTQLATDLPMIQTDAPINPGNSGGPLADRYGRVIGINDAIYTGGNSSSGGQPGNVGVGFAIPIDLAKSVADRIVAGKPITAGFLGIEGQDATGSRAGALVRKVTGGTPADKAGLKVGDVVVAINGQPVQSMADLAAAVRIDQPGQQVQLTVLRGGKQLAVTVTLGKSPN